MATEKLIEKKRDGFTADSSQIYISEKKLLNLLASFKFVDALLHEKTATTSSFPNSACKWCEIGTF